MARISSLAHPRGLVLGAALSAVSSTLLLGCGGPATCVTGTSQGCSCVDGRVGAQVCRSDGTFDACVCGSGLDTGLTDAFAAASDAPGPDGEPTMDAPPPADTTLPSCAIGAACDCPGDTVGYCESGREGPLCECDPGPVPCAQDVDWLFLVDTSNSMAEEQVALVSELPRLVRILASGDADEDGTADFTPVRSLQLGVVTPDLGAGDYDGVPSCTRGFGEDGILRRRPAPDPGCPRMDYPSSVFAFAPGTGVEPDAFAADFACVAHAGTGGCGFEQQLEAVLRATAPSRPAPWTRSGFVPPTFRDGSFGHGDGANAGFLRADSMLALTLVTDEDDCSVPDTALFVTGDPRFMSVPLNLRCYVFDETSLHPTSRYVDGLLGLRPHPGLLVYSAITGIPARSFTDYDALLLDPDMTFRPNAMGTAAEPACTSATGLAFPARRIVAVARDLEDAGVQTSVSSICASSFESAVSDIVRALIAARGSC